MMRVGYDEFWVDSTYLRIMRNAGAKFGDGVDGARINTAFLNFG
jgi:hypothetical protein